MIGFTESVVEEAAFDWLRGLGYAVLSGPDIAFGEPAAERSDPGSRDTILSARFRTALERLNPDLPREAIDEAFRKLQAITASGLVLRNPNRPVVARPEGLVHDDEMSAQIEAMISGEVNPALAAHGGFVTYVGHDGEGTAYLTMGGGCHGCSMSKMTMLDGVQTMLVEAIDGLLRVQDITDHATGENPYYS